MVFKGGVNFQSSFAGYVFETIEISSFDPQIIKASISASERDGVLLTMELDHLPTLEDATHKAKEFALYIAKMLTFEFNVFHQNFKWVNDTLIEERPDGSSEMIGNVGMGFELEGDLVIVLGEKSLSSLKDSLQRKPSDSFSYDQFYYAFGLTDAISKFMALYNIVLTLCNDRQEDVDRFVLEVQPNIPVDLPYRPRKSGTPETLYTRLRNQIAHVRHGTTIESTGKEMERILSGLVEVTKKRINKSFPKL
ncbi:MAG: hypothetical protein OHK0047_31210 [Leptolyngbyaceae cyanobacterium]